ncbi:cation:proton antiporter [Parahaliea mediterranea]|uniref:cation:proton antiporter n=1 Tax=Parahaliea mediterranea TaxID=651086 RepID=UPI0019D4B072|nr:sodium:proton antiporter [Parahaliea mediterranea]
MNNLLTIGLVCLGIIAYALASRRLDRALVTLPMVFVALGYALAQLGMGGGLSMDTTALHVFAEVTLVLVLFTDAASVHFRSARHSLGIPARMLLLGMPLTIALGSLVAWWAAPGVPLVMAVLLAAILTPTDAALGQAIMASPQVPQRLREAINIESGLNDGLAVPVIMASAVLAAGATGTAFHGAPDNMVRFIILQLLLGPLTGAVVGWLLARLLDRALEQGWVSGPGRAIAVLAGAILCFTLAEYLGGNGFIAAFIGGLVLGNTLRAERAFIFEFMEGEGQVLTMLTFTLFGALLLPIGLAHASWQSVLLALAFLTVVRMLPIWLSLAGSGLNPLYKLSLGWFGPRGLASILFLLLIDEQFNLPGFEDIMACVVMAVLLSIVAHGVTANPVARYIGRRYPAGAPRRHQTPAPPEGPAGFRQSGYRQ